MVLEKHMVPIDYFLVYILFKGTTISFNFEDVEQVIDRRQYDGHATNDPNEQQKKRIRSTGSSVHGDVGGDQIRNL